MNYELEKAFVKDFRKLKNKELASSILEAIKQVSIEKNTVTFVAFAHRKEIYNRFP